MYRVREREREREVDVVGERWKTGWFPVGGRAASWNGRYLPEVR